MNNRGVFNYNYQVYVVKDDKYYTRLETLAEADNAHVAIAAFETARHIRTQAVIQLCNMARIMRTEWTVDVADKRPPFR